MCLFWRYLKSFNLGKQVNKFFFLFFLWVDDKYLVTLDDASVMSKTNALEVNDKNYGLLVQRCAIKYECFWCYLFHKFTFFVFLFCSAYKGRNEFWLERCRSSGVSLFFFQNKQTKNQLFFVVSNSGRSCGHYSLEGEVRFFRFWFSLRIATFINQFNVFCLQVKCNFQLRPWTLYIQVLANVFVVKFFALFDCLLLNLRCCCFVALHFPLGARRYKGSRSSISANIDIARHRVIALWEIGMSIMTLVFFLFIIFFIVNILFLQ